MKCAVGLLNGLYPAVAAALAIAIIGLLGLWAGIPWLFASLGPSLAIQVGAPDTPAARPWNVVAGQFSGAAAGFVAVHATGAFNAPAVNEAHLLSGTRVAAAALAVLLSIVLQHVLRARHPAAESTTLLLALGGLQATTHSAIVIAIGIILAAVLGEFGRYFALVSVRRR